MPNYQNSKIYRIEAPSRPDLLPYYGSTTVPLSSRMAKHRYKTNPTVSRALMECEDARIVLMEAFPCNSKEELNAREAKWIRENPCCNYQIPGGRTKEELKDGDKEAMKEYYASYREKNREKLRQYQCSYMKTRRANVSQSLVPPATEDTS